MLDRQKGSHMTLVREDPFKALTIPNDKELDVAAGMTIEEFRALL